MYRSDGRVGNAAKPGRLDGMRGSYSCGASILNGSMIIWNDSVTRGSTLV